MAAGKVSTVPKTLLQQCTNLVASNLDIVDSFIGLPSLIGERIFKKACCMGRLEDTVYCTQTVRLFSEAYGEEFLSSLNLNGMHLGLNYCLEQLLLFRDIVQLNLSYCGLGDDHEMLAQFENLTRLQVLCLRGNAVSDLGIQKMTLPYRMFARGPEQLQTVDIRDNGGISRECLKYFNKFCFLREVLFSYCQGRQKGCHGDWILQVSSAGDEELVVITKGWADVLIDRWMDEAESKARQPKQKTFQGVFSLKKKPLQMAYTDSSRNIWKERSDQVYLIAKRSQGGHLTDNRFTRKGINESNSKVKPVLDTHEADTDDVEQIQCLHKDTAEEKSESDLDTPEAEKGDVGQILDLYKVTAEVKSNSNRGLLVNLDLLHDNSCLKHGMTSSAFVHGDTSKKNIAEPLSRCSLDKTKVFHQATEASIPVKNGVLNEKKFNIYSTKHSSLFTNKIMSNSQETEQKCNLYCHGNQKITDVKVHSVKDGVGGTLEKTNMLVNPKKRKRIIVKNSLTMISVGDSCGAGPDTGENEEPLSDLETESEGVLVKRRKSSFLNYLDSHV